MQLRKGLNTMIILVAWELWKHRNKYVFDDMQPRIQVVITIVMEEAGLWKMTGAKNLASLFNNTKVDELSG
ncbi:hypothetical protein PR202_gb18655 [Eleusine coracana subsp. coracana]|uniref:Uncharacterized protein n=1 Tax=Eleusine coracana subsp. coracana TaxID=191504 RepID=A0AAV5F3X8_ELECO|nr:hypothetical protein PR202_gb18655 [Eleusine coracana subsp. coracana]